MIGYPFTILDEVDSSNNYAIGQITQGLAHHGAAILAKHQTKGKGQRGNSWSDEKGKNIALSVILVPSGVKTTSQFALNIAISLAVFDLITKYATDETYIKWPNDIYWRDRKAVGILIESRILGQIWQWAVAGIGINVNQTDFNEYLGTKAVSLKQITGKELSCEFLAKELCMNLEFRYNQFLSNKFDTLLEQYNLHLFKRNEEVSLQYNDQIYTCLINRVDIQGNLYIENGPKPYFTHGEIQWLIHQNKQI